MARILKTNRASILILVLWILGLLSLFAVQIGLTIGQRIQLLVRTEQNQRLRFLTLAGVKKGIAALRADLRDNNGVYTPFGKYFRHNNEDVFGKTQLGEGSFEVSYRTYDINTQGMVKRYGVSDEESRLNINLAHRAELGRLIQRVAGVEDNRAVDIVDGIIGWREQGDASMEGFYSDNYYYNLEHFYNAKDSLFEVPEELLLVYGVTPEVYQRLLPYITVYGDGLVNINTAPAPVLYALGFEDEVIQKIIFVRQGVDGEEGTVDDHIFRQPYDVVVEMRAFVPLEEPERGMIDQVNARGRLKANSSFYRIESTASVPNRPGEMYAYGVYNSQDNWIEYYYEK